MQTFHFCAIDLGATSGRVAVGHVTSEAISFDIVHRFPHEAKRDEHGTITWNWQGLLADIEKGLTGAAQRYQITSVAVDTWAVDYILYNGDGTIAAPTYSYRDFRTDGIMEELIEKYGKAHLYKENGIQFLPFNTIYQLVAAQRNGELVEGRTFLMLPDAVNRFLCDARSNEITNASSTQLLNGRTRQWDWPLIDELDIPRSIFPALHEAGKDFGYVKNIPGLAQTKVVAVASHDTASAVAAAPMVDPDHAIYISSGTWSLVGCELNEPITDASALNVNMTNELGINGTVRFLKNVSGMWIISELLREWSLQGEELSVEELVRAAQATTTDARIDPNDPVFLHPGPMVERVQFYCAEHEGVVPQSKGEIALCVYLSLAESYDRTIKEIENATGKRFSSISVVGGGSANDFLNQLTANATQMTVYAGPVEATLLGNVGVQAMAAGVIEGIDHLRRLVREHARPREYRPR